MLALLAQSIGQNIDWTPVLINLIVAAFIYGGLAATVRSNNKAIASIWKELKSQRDDTKKALDKHGDELAAHGERLARVESEIPRTRGAAGGSFQ
jgi:hypothetical protein